MLDQTHDTPSGSSRDPVSLDAWSPDPAVRTRHVRSTDADPDALWQAARSVRLDETRLLGRLVSWRIPDLAEDQTFAGLLGEYPFIALEEGPRHVVSGLCGRIWTLARDYPRLDGPEAFRAWDEPGTVRVVLGHWVSDDGTLVSEARVQPVDRGARMRLRALWAVIGRFEGVIASEPLPIAASRARGRPAPTRRGTRSAGRGAR